MDTLISDQGREFVNSITDNLMEHFETFHLHTTHKQMANGNMTIEHSKNLLASLSMTKETTGTSSSLVFCLTITHLCTPQPSALRVEF